MKIITRKEAKAKGLKTYFTGIACKHDHIAKRRTVNCECVACEKARKTKTVVTEVKKMIRMVVFSPYSRRGCPEIVVDKMIAA